jgi:hypothetical protein
VKKSHNGKRIEVTFAHEEATQEYLKSVEDIDQSCLGHHDVCLVSIEF